MSYIKKKHKVLLLVIAITLSIMTYILPIFSGLPRCIYLNIAGSFLVAYGMGPAIGGVYAGVLNLGISSFGMGSGLNLAILTIQVIESGLIGLLRFKKVNDFINIVIICAILTLFYKPLSQFIYIVFSNNINSLELSIKNIYIEYVNNGILPNLITYLFSGLVTYVILVSTKKLFYKE